MKPARKNNGYTIDENDPRSKNDLTPAEKMINDEDNLDTRFVSNEIEEGDEDYDDEELKEEDFAGEDDEDEIS